LQPNNQDGDLFRVDPLTSSQNFLSFIETLAMLAANPHPRQLSIIYLDFDNIHLAYGDSVVRWMEIVLREESLAPTFRVGKDEFAAILNTGLLDEHTSILEQIETRLKAEASAFGIFEHVARIALIHYDETDPKGPENVLINIGAALTILRGRRYDFCGVFQARDLPNVCENPPVNNAFSSDACHLLGWLADLLVNRIQGLGRMLDESQQSALTDSVSGLPNMRAARKALRQAHQQAITTKQPFSILLIDGDDLRRYNAISYAEGDEMIRQLSKILAENLRYQDFLARWRTGDEWIVILPGTSKTEASIVGERFCNAIRNSSQKWIIPTSISIGISSYPEFGDMIETLLTNAENALKQAKALGKDRVHYNTSVMQV
jgi:diguanylate cyclase (GGDEF)-like protein